MAGDPGERSLRGRRGFELDDPAVHGGPVAAALGVVRPFVLRVEAEGEPLGRFADELIAAWAQLGRVTCVLEQRLPLAAECSVIVARGADGTTVHLPVQRNLHRDGILAVTEVWPGSLLSVWS